MNFTADFETTTKTDDCRVWAYGLYSIDDDSFYHGNNIHDFFEFLKEQAKKELTKVYFQNLKFDGEFLLSYLLQNGYDYVEDRKELNMETFTTLITDNKVFYSIEVCFGGFGRNKQKVIFYDSLKILPFSVEEVAKAFNLPIQKLELDYTKERPVGHELTTEELLYLKNDVQIMGMALKTLFSQKMNRMTAGSNALHDFKKMCKDFKEHFPVLPYDKELRESYKGGFTYVSPRFKGKVLGKGIVLDVNSLYPSIMRNRELPYGEGKFFEGRYEIDNLYPLYIQMIRCQFELKDKHIPSIQIKKNMRFIDTEYLESSGDEEVILCLTSVDLKLFIKQYHIYNLEFLGGWKFKATKGIFTDYIDKWSQVKIQSAIDGNKGMYTLSKLMLNSLYGKFATNPNVQGSFPYLNKDGIVNYDLLEKEERDPVYLPVASFITAWARWITITSAQKNYDRFIYADTDSLHLIGTDPPVGIELDPNELGKWDHEFTFSKAKYLRQKAYIQTGRKTGSNEEFTKVTMAGMPSSIHEFVDYKNFHEGTTFTIDKEVKENAIVIPIEKAKLRPKRVKGGVVLEPTYFTIRK